MSVASTHGNVAEGLSPEQQAERDLIQSYLESGRIDEYIEKDTYAFMNELGYSSPEIMVHARNVAIASLKCRLDRYGLKCPELDDD